ncbi:MAG: ARMT1-like domain-containing protein [candidate division KSB1 bacterium]|nr:ARMT1-like domain-containing protein [candidate division KSB1 bacterium]MDZ7336358.1 ARMT1-like domain-containing protein [candidate division KSB1 bacterium]MDZ7356662.1 ARMT1-like domain-containing protein [candidate division KSB1 bacterium]MDZ7376588.1 ARMT1-like domain-containing protein [candidate division KSB1 bacterium]MDZ7398539.1 ARMT1-like domain-containing protein [candidate division KSB1 bacterium]
MTANQQEPIQSTYDCIPCAIGSLITLFKKGLVSERDQEIAMRALLRYLSTIDFHQSPPQIGQQMQRIIRHVLNNPDPYLEIKQQFNRLLLDHYVELKAWVDQAADPFQMALRLSIAGNVIDFGPNQRFDVHQTLERAKTIVLAIDDSEPLRQAISKATLLLYLGDNAGEIVLDRIFLETINHPNVYFAVRSAPIINDALLEDAIMVGIDKIAHVITNGDDAPGTILENTSAQFKTIFDQADLIISKGQGNYEGLSCVDKNIFFLLMTKCEHVANHLGVKKGDFVVKQGQGC